MVTVEERVDPRIRRTRALLVQAFVELLGEKRFEAISVKDIAERAGVNRATFYDHFQDRYNLLDSVIGDLFRRAVRLKMEMPEEKLTDVRHLGPPTSTTVVRRPLKLPSLREEFRLFVVATFEAFNFLRELQAHHRFYVEPAAVIYPRIRQEIRTILVSDFHALLNAVSEAEADHLAYVLTWVLYGSAFDWIRSGKSISADELSARTVAIVGRELLRFH